jgi:GNAT superfamily N-acetyltransferase
MILSFYNFILENNEYNSLIAKISLPKNYDDIEYIYGQLLYKKEYIGKFELEIKFDEDDEKQEYDLDDEYTISIYGFEIEDKYRNKGIGKISFEKIIKLIEEEFQNNNGIYLSVFADNINAINIYNQFGFNTYDKDMYSNKLVLYMKK